MHLDLLYNNQSDLLYNNQSDLLYNNHVSESTVSVDNIVAKSMAKKLKSRLIEIFDNQFTADLYNDNRNTGEGNKLRTYRNFKHKIYTENYLTVITDRNIRKNFTRLRISAHNLPIEKGRHRRPQKTPINERFCDTCNEREIGDETHIIMFCKFFETQRESLFRKICEIHPDFSSTDTFQKFNFIMKGGDIQLIINLAIYIKEITKIRGDF